MIRKEVHVHVTNNSVINANTCKNTDVKKELTHSGTNKGVSWRLYLDPWNICFIRNNACIHLQDIYAISKLILAETIRIFSICK